jgi:hypothetical protein
MKESSPDPHDDANVIAIAARDGNANRVGGSGGVQRRARASRHEQHLRDSADIACYNMSHQVRYLVRGGAA